jgi:ABC-type methionine transport system permease subunit
MPTRQVTKKRKGKANKRKFTSSKTLAIRIMRAAFFLFIGLLVIYFYYIYENGSLVEIFLVMNLEGIFKSVMDYLQEYPFKVIFYMINSLLMLVIGYLFGRRGFHNHRG